MKSSNPDKFHESAFTVAEMGVAVGVLGLLGLAFFQVLNAGLILSAKNTAVNAAHEEARMGVLRMTRDIHASVSVPQLRDNGFNVISSDPVGGVAPTAAAVSFQDIASGPDFVWKDPSNPSLIMIRDNPKPEPGMRLIVPFFGLEEDVTKVAAAGTSNHSNVFIKSDQSTPNIDAPSFGNSYAITYYTDRTMYVVRKGSYIPDSQGPYSVTTTAYTSSNYDRFVLTNGSYAPSATGTLIVTPTLYTGSGQRYRFEDGELHLYKQRYNGSATYWQDFATVAKYVSSPQPFYVPLNRFGSPDSKYVGVKLSARDPKSSNRGYLATASLLDTQIDYRSRLTVTQ
ncbi:MAG: type II secretion system protein J [Chthoniobacterales bacterium]